MEIIEIYWVENNIQFNFFTWHQLTELIYLILTFDSLNCFSHIQILNSINQIVKLQSIIWFDCIANTETFSTA